MRFRILALIPFMGLAIACGGGLSVEDEMSGHPARVVPQGASQIFFARIEPLRANPLAGWAGDQLSSASWSTAFRGIVQTLERAGSTERVVAAMFGSTEKQRQTPVLVVAQGKFDEQAFLKNLQTAGIPSVASGQDERRYYTVGRGVERSFVAFPSAGSIIVATQEQLVTREQDLLAGRTESIAEDRGFQARLATWTPEIEFWGTGFLPAALAAGIGIERPSVQMIESFTMLGDMQGDGNATKFNLILNCTSGEAAVKNAELLKQLVGLLLTQAVQVGYRLNHLAGVVGRSQIVVEGRTANYEVELTAQELDATAKALQAGPDQPMIQIEDLAPRPE